MQWDIDACCCSSKQSRFVSCRTLRLESRDKATIGIIHSPTRHESVGMLVAYGRSVGSYQAVAVEREFYVIKKLRFDVAIDK
mmetsp:Transcript_16978/g.38983  ORF Transcript_16978/g.38983 Transcript_16978/m.38983 type:complete len:82 (+) Transcript_16978:1274-1519(+)